MRARLLLNPSSGRGRGRRLLPLLAERCRRHAIQLEQSDGADDLARRARRAASEGVERLLVAGGDGTYHWVAQGLAGSDTALAPIALGTGNDLARELRIPLDPMAAIEKALELPTTRIDLGRIGERYFCGVAGVGFDAAVAQYARTRVRLLRGPAVYAWALLATLPGYRPARYSIELGDPGDQKSARREEELYLFAFANTSHYGGGMRIAPDADPADGRLDFVLLRSPSRWRILRVFPKVYSGRHVGDPCFEVVRARGASIAVEPAQWINADGEGLGRTGQGRLAIGMAPGALRVVCAPGRSH